MKRKPQISHIMCLAWSTKIWTFEIKQCIERDVKTKHNFKS